MKIKNIFFLFLFFITCNTFAQSSFKKISRPEKIWAFTHPFVAKKTYRITQKVEQIVDSIKAKNIIGNDNNGGKLDAFKHAFWMANIAQHIGKRKALKLGIAHEKGNKIQFKKHQLEEKILPDSVSSEMDLYNNEQGAIAGISISKNEKLQTKILEALYEGKLKIIKKDEQGNFLTCNGEKIILQNWFGKWNIPKCLIASNEH